MHMEAGNTVAIAPEDLQYLLPKGGFYILHCAILMEPLTDPLKCLTLCSDRSHNKRCVKHNCISPFKICPSCLVQNELEKIGAKGPVFCEKKKNLCRDHHVYGEGAHRSIPERQKALEKYEDEKLEALILREMEIEQQAAAKKQQAADEERLRVQKILQSRERQEQNEKWKAEHPKNGAKPASAGTPTGYVEDAVDVEIVDDEELVQTKETAPAKEDRLALIRNGANKAKAAATPAPAITSATVEKPPASVEEVETLPAPEEMAITVLESHPAVPEVPVEPVVNAASVPLALEMASADDLKKGAVIQIHQMNKEGVLTSKDVEIISDMFYAQWDEISPYKKQPRKTFNVARLRELAGSIEEEGQIMPVLLRRLEDGGKYKWELVDGERRYRACGMINKKLMKAILVDVKDEKEQFRQSAIANFCREDCTELEIALAIKRFMGEEFGYTEAAVAKTFGKSGTWVTQHLSLLKLHPEVLDMMDEELPKGQKIPYTVGTYLAYAKEQDFQLVLAKEIIAKKLKTSQAYAHIRRRIKEVGGELPQKKRGPRDDFRVFNALMHRTRTALEHFSVLGTEQFQELLKFRPIEDRQQTVDNLENIIVEARKLQDMVRAMTQ